MLNGPMLAANLHKGRLLRREARLCLVRAPVAWFWWNRISFQAVTVRMLIITWYHAA